VVADIREVALMMPAEAADVCILTDLASQPSVAGFIKDLTELSKIRGLLDMYRRGACMAEDGESYSAISEYQDKTLLEIDGLRESGYQHVARSMSRVLTQIEDRFKNRGKISGVPTGFNKLDEMTNGWQNQDYIVIGARPSVGKTAGMLNSISAALRAKKKVGLFSAEMNVRSILMRMISDWANVDSTKLRSGFIANTDVMRIAEVCQEIGNTGLFVNDTPNIPFDSWRISEE
jgi:replicative DNA helicase